MDMAKPTIRFKGYQDDWEQRKLGDVVEDYVEKTTVEDQYPVLTSSQRKGIVLQDDFFAGDRVNQNGNIGYFIIPRGYFAFRSRSDNDVFVFNRNDAVDMGIISYFYPVFKPRGVDSDFLLRRLNYGLEDQIKINSEGTGQHVLSLKKFKNMIGLFPSYEEQKKIGSYFSQIDHLITLHQRKCDETKRLKKYMLQKMFPQNGEKVPEIRFSGFTDDWEQRKVTDLGEIYIGLVTTMTEHYTDKGHLLIRNSDIKDGYFEFGENPIYLDEEFSEQNKSRMHQLGDVITVHTGDIGTSAVIGENEVNSIGFATIVTRPNQEILDSNYFATYLNTDTHKQWAISMATGDGRSNYNLKDYTKLVVPIPEIEEQKKIATCIVNLNSLITLHQRELENLQNIKKFMLGKMFV